MIILISGAKYTGKTLLAKRLSERYQIPYESIDFVKQGLVLGDKYMEQCVENNDNALLETVWFVLENKIQNYMDRGESVVMEGDYLSPQKVRLLNDAGVLSMHLLFSPEYIEKNYDTIIKYRQLDLNMSNVCMENNQVANIHLENKYMENAQTKNKQIENGHIENNQVANKQTENVYVENTYTENATMENMPTKILEKNISKNDMLEENRILKDRCSDEVVSYFMFQENFENEMDLVCDLLDCMRP